MHMPFGYSTLIDRQGSKGMIKLNFFSSNDQIEFKGTKARTPDSSVVDQGVDAAEGVPGPLHRGLHGRAPGGDVQLHGYGTGT
jgi:hypothetical protein